MVGLIGWLWDNWSWIGALVAGPFAIVARQAGYRWIGWALVAACVVLAVWTAWSRIAADRLAERQAAWLGGYQTSQMLNRAQVELARVRLAGERDANVIVGRDLMDRLEALRDRIDAQTREAEEEARDAAPTDPVCTPSERSIRVWNDAVERANRAAAGADAQ